MTSQSRLSYASAKKDRDYWGRLVESAVGAHLLNGAEGTMVEVYYWKLLIGGQGIPLEEFLSAPILNWLE